MRLLFIHADRIWFKVGRKTKAAESLADEDREREMTDCLLAFACVEKCDEANPTETVGAVVADVKKACERIKEKKVMLFPFAHLSEELGDAEVALKILKDIEARLASDGYTIIRAPFGWYKEFELKSKGHPLAVLSRTFCPKAAECDLACNLCGAKTDDQK